MAHEPKRPTFIRSRISSVPRSVPVVRLAEELLRFSDVLPGRKPLGGSVALPKCAAAEIGTAGSVIFRVDEGRLQDHLLVDEVEHGPAGLDTVEGRWGFHNAVTGRC